MGKNKICVAGWHFFEKFYKMIEKSDSDIYVVAHRYKEVLERRKIKYSITKNVGLEFGAYDWYIKNKWDGESNVLFMHDDIEILDFDEFILSNYDKFKSRQIEHGYIVSGRHCGVSGRFFYMSREFLRVVKEEHDGMWYDKENFGYTSEKSQPEGWRVRRYNDGGPAYLKMIEAIGEEYDFKTAYTIVDPRLQLYDMGITKIKSNFSAAEKILRRKAINRQKSSKTKPSLTTMSSCIKRTLDLPSHLFFIYQS